MSAVGPQSDSPAAGGRLISLAITRERLGQISKGALYALIERGELPTVRVGPRRRFVDERDLEAFIAARREVADEASLESASPALAGDSATRDQLDNGQGNTSG
jgi:excisionase family DNA binding protein